MDNGKIAGMNCFTCGKPLTPVRLGSAGQCPRCATVDALIEELIRKQLRDNGSAMSAAMSAGGAL